MAVSKPLAGKRIVVTQAEHQAAALCDLLAGRGAVPLRYPCIAIEPSADATALDTALQDAAAGRYHWLVVTSANTVRVLARRLAVLGLEGRDLSRLAVAAVGRATTAAVGEMLGRDVDLVPDEHVAEGLAAALAIRLQPGQRVLLPQADIARPVLAEELTATGAQVTALAAYRTVPGRGGVDLPALLAAGEIDAITFTSSSTARNLLQRLAAEGGDPQALAGVCMAAIGAITAGTMRELGFPATVVAETQSIEGLVTALENHWKQRPS